MRQLAVLIAALVLSAPTRAAGLPAAEGDKTPFPTVEWNEFAPDDPLRIRMEKILAGAFEGARPEALTKTRAMVVAVRGRIAAERYAEGITRDTRLQSWSMSKSLLHAALGLAALDGKIDPDGPAPVPALRRWNNGDHPITTMRHLMTMTDGLAFREDYGDTTSEAMQMLFGAGRGDVGAFAAGAPIGHQPGYVWSYSSGSANILSMILRDALGGREAYARFLKERLFAPLGMKSAVAEFDASGSWIASSYVHATARDFARFGLFYLSKGFWDGRQIIARDWAKAACEPTKASGGKYGELWWLNRKDGVAGPRAVSDDLPEDMCFARGFGGQLIAVAPSQDAVIVMLNGAYTDETAPIIHLMSDILAAAAPAPPH